MFITPLSMNGGGEYNLFMPEFRFFKTIDVRYGDLDPQGHVNNVRYFSYIEDARVAYIRHLELWDGKSFLDVGLIVADAQLTFREPVLYGQDIRVGVRVSRLGNKSLTMDYTIQNAADGREHASGATVLVAYDYRLKKSIPLPDGWREVIRNFEII